MKIPCLEDYERKTEGPVVAKASQADSSNTNSRKDFHFGQVFKAISTMRSSSLRVAPVDA